MIDGTGKVWNRETNLGAVVVVQVGGFGSLEVSGIDGGREKDIMDINSRSNRFCWWILTEVRGREEPKMIPGVLFWATGIVELLLPHGEGCWRSKCGCAEELCGSWMGTWGHGQWWLKVGDTQYACWVMEWSGEREQLMMQKKEWSAWTGERWDVLKQSRGQTVIGTQRDSVNEQECWCRCLVGLMVVGELGISLLTTSSFSIYIQQGPPLWERKEERGLCYFAGAAITKYRRLGG